MRFVPAHHYKQLNTHGLSGGSFGHAVAPSDVMEFKRILVAVNSANGRDAAFERALALAKASGAELYLLYAVPMNEPYSFRSAERLERMADMRTRAQDAGVRVKTVEQQGDAAEIIELHANAREVDLIVMGGEVRRNWGRRSWVAEKVIRRTKVPTLVVPSGASGSSTVFGNVLVAVDLSAASEDVLRGAVGLSAGQPVKLTVMHLVNGLEAADAVQSPARWKVPEFRTHVLDDARRTLEGLVSDVAAGIDTRVEVSAGSASRAILEHAADVDADLVVMGRSRGFKLLGSTALRVLRKNDRALLVIPSTAHRTGQVERHHAA
jgi:nucleotide-binding universal stress UspA family protein